MSRKGLLALLAGVAIAGVSAGSGQAFYAEGADFAVRAGSAAALTVGGESLGPAEMALRDQLAHAGRDGEYHDKRDGAGVAEFYAGRNYAPVWVEDGRLTDDALKVMARLRQAAEDGLDPSVFATPVATLGTAVPAGPSRAAQAEIMLSLAVSRYVREAYAGRVDPSEISANIDIRQHLPDPIEALATIAAADDRAAAMAGFNPQQPGYLALRAKLAELRMAAADEAPIVIPEGKTLKIGMTDPRVALLRTRLEVTATAEDITVFDEAVDAAVKAFQAGQGLTADGAVGPNTLAALNGPKVNAEAEIVANMERWRWMPRDLGRFYVHVNIPEFTLRVMKDGQLFHTTRVVVGKVATQTPIFNDEIEHVIVNPYWNVPASIVAKEMVPQLVGNPGAVAGYEVYHRGQRVDPFLVDWATVNPRAIAFRQPPGERNALGRIKFMFPNEHDVYLHDTPSKSLFQRDVRAFSHGCVRVMNPMDFAAALLSEDPLLSAAKIQKLVGGRETKQDMANHVPVYLTYFTAFVDDAGELQLRNDIYGHSAKVRAALGLDQPGT